MLKLASLTLAYTIFPGNLHINWQESSMAVDDSEIPDPQSLILAMIVGPYFGDGSYEVIDGNIARARAYAVELANLRIGFFCAHPHTGHFEVYAAAPESFYLGLDLRYLSLADCVIFTPGWQQSSGSRREHTKARQLGLQRFYPESTSDLIDVASWALAQPRNALLPVLTALSEVEAWVRHLRKVHDLRGWSHNDTAMISRLHTVATLQLASCMANVHVLSDLLREVGGWTTDYLAYVGCLVDDPVELQLADAVADRLNQAEALFKALLPAA